MLLQMVDGFSLWVLLILNNLRRLIRLMRKVTQIFMITLWIIVVVTERKKPPAQGLIAATRVNRPTFISELFIILQKISMTNFVELTVPHRRYLLGKKIRTHYLQFKLKPDRRRLLTSKPFLSASSILLDL